MKKNLIFAIMMIINFICGLLYYFYTYKPLKALSVEPIITGEMLFNLYKPSMVENCLVFVFVFILIIELYILFKRSICKITISHNEESES